MTFNVPGDVSIQYGGYLRLIMPADYNTTLRSSSLNCSLTSASNTVIQYGGVCSIRGLAIRILLQQTITSNQYTLTVSIYQPLFFH